MTSIAAASSPIAPARPGKALHIGLWIAQILLAAMFLMAGFMKATTPIAELSAKMSAPGVLGAGLIRFIGVSEILGGIGLILPAATRVRPILTPIAGAALAFVMVLAAGYHIMQGELSGLPINFALGALAAFVAWGRLRRAPIEARS